MKKGLVLSKKPAKYFCAAVGSGLLLICWGVGIIIMLNEQRKKAPFLADKGDYEKFNDNYAKLQGSAALPKNIDVFLITVGSVLIVLGLLACIIAFKKDPKDEEDLSPDLSPQKCPWMLPKSIISGPPDQNRYHTAYQNKLVEVSVLSENRHSPPTVQLEPPQQSKRYPPTPPYDLSDEDVHFKYPVIVPVHQMKPFDSRVRFS